MPRDPYGPLRLAKVAHNIDAEMMVLGTLLHDGGAKLLPAAKAVLRPDSFVYGPHVALFREILWLAKDSKPFGGVFMKAWAEQEQDFADNSDAAFAYLERLMGCIATPINFGEYCVLIAKLTLQRQVDELGPVNFSSLPAKRREVQRLMAAMDVLDQSAKANDDLICGPDLLNIVFADLPHFVDGLIAPGLTLLISKPKVGKSWLVLNLALAIAEGGLALSDRQTEPSDVLCLMLEDSRRRVQKRLRKLLHGRTCPAGLMITTKWLKGDAAVAKAEAYLQTNPICRVVFVDLWAKVRGNGNGESSGYSSDYGDLAAWQTLAQQYDVAIVMLHHSRKAEADDIVDLVSGTLGASGAVDHLIVLKGNRDDGYEIAITGRDLLAKEWDASLDDGEWRLIGEKQGGGKRIKDAVDHIDERVKVREMHEAGKSNRDIAKALKLSATTVRRRLTESANGI